jgi:ATP-dependent RNA helicase DDX54/DBP10
MTTNDISDIAVRKANLSKLMSDSIEISTSNEAKDYKDRKFFMTYGTEDERANFEEQSLQPQSGLRSSETMMASQLESSFLDVLPEEALEMNKKRRILRWDAKKRKFVKQSLEEMSANKGNKRIRTESGVTQTSSRPQGELYEKWKKKSKREINTGNTDDDDDFRNRPNFKVNRNVKDELRSATDIRKLHQVKSKNKLKNMEKDKRASVEKKMKKSTATFQNKKLMNNDRRRKGKVIIRM